MFTIKWKENGDTFEKTYDTKAGLDYRRRSIVKKFGKEAIVSESKLVKNDDGTTVEIGAGKTNKAEAMKGPVDENLAIMGAGPNDTAPRLQLSNWNHKTKSYTSRMYGADFGRSVRVIEPDGQVSLQGPRNKVVKHVIKGSYLNVLSDGRVFDAFGWAVSPNEDLLPQFMKNANVA